MIRQRTHRSRFSRAIQAPQWSRALAGGLNPLQHEGQVCASEKGAAILRGGDPEGPL